MESKSIVDLLNHYRKKKNRLIVVLSFSFVFMVTLILIFVFSLKINLKEDDIVSTLLIVLLLIYLFAIMYYKGKLSHYIMNYNYFLMLNDNVKEVNLPNKLFTKLWIDKLESFGYKLHINNNKYMIYYHVFSKIKYLPKSDNVFIAIVLAKTPMIDFYSDELQKNIDIISQYSEKGKKIKKIVVLQFKQYEEFNETVKDEIDKIINYKEGSNYLINITIGYFEKANKVYFLQPKKRYPNKYYYYACQTIRDLCEIN